MGRHQTVPIEFFPANHSKPVITGNVHRVRYRGFAPRKLKRLLLFGENNYAVLRQGMGPML
jgi:hypothetical protein